MPVRRNRRSRVKPAAPAVDPLEAAISEPDPFPGKVLALIKNDVQDLDRILEIEKRGMFDPRQSPAFCSAYDRDRERHIIADLCSREQAEQFELVAKWFEWRKHPELAQRYMERARVVNEILSEKEHSK